MAKLILPVILDNLCDLLILCGKKTCVAKEKDPGDTLGIIRQPAPVIEPAVDYIVILLYRRTGRKTRGQMPYSFNAIGFTNI